MSPDPRGQRQHLVGVGVAASPPCLSLPVGRLSRSSCCYVVIARFHFALSRPIRRSGHGKSSYAIGLTVSTGDVRISQALAQGGEELDALTVGRLRLAVAQEQTSRRRREAC